MKSLLRSLVLLLVVAQLTHAHLIHVPENELTIQAGIDAASDGDTVLVQPGIYKENINYSGKNIVVGSLFLTSQDTSYISQTAIDGNQRGSVVTFEYGEGSTAVLSGFTITNGSGHKGGGIYCDNSSPRLEYVTISENNSKALGTYVSNGGGIYCTGSSPTLEHVTISRNIAYSGDGGGIYCDASSPRLEHVTINRNSATYGGGIRCVYASSPRLGHVTIIENTARELGGGIYCTESNPSLKQVTISRNSALGGGGVYCIGSSPRLEYVTISENRAAMAGGGVYCIGSSPRLEYVTISENRAEEGGAGLHCIDKSNPSLKYVTIMGNSTFEGTGGMLCTYGSSPSLEHVTIRGNSVKRGGGGGLSFYSSTPSLKHVVITGNSAVSSGGMFPLRGIGGLSCVESSPRLEYVTITGNSAILGGGGVAYGGMYCSESSPMLKHVTISENDGGGIYCSKSRLKLVNTILWNNEYIRDEPGGDQVHLYDGSSIFIAYSDVKQGRPGIGAYDNASVHWLEGNIEEDPLFVDAKNGDFRLEEHSPCIDAGTAFFVLEGDTLMDVSSDDFVGSAPDMGAFEFGLVVGIKETRNTLPTTFQLKQNYPNPGNPVTTIAYDLPRASDVTVTIYTITGQKIAVLGDAHQEAGHHTVFFNGSGLGSGLYLYRLEAGRFVETRRMVLLK